MSFTNISILGVEKRGISFKKTWQENTILK